MKFYKVKISDKILDEVIIEETLKKLGVYNLVDLQHKAKCSVNVSKKSAKLSKTRTKQ